MKLKISHLLFITCLFLASQALNAQSDYTFLIEKYLRAKDKLSEINGVVLVAKNNEIIYQKAFGFANRELKIPNTINTRFKIGGITSNITAAAIMQLQHQGVLNIADTVDKYFANIIDRKQSHEYLFGNSMRLHHLLTHSSGLKDFWELEGILGDDMYQMPKDTLIKKISNAKRNNWPGYTFEYGSTGYYVLGRIAERVSGQAFDEYVNTYILKIAGMYQSGFVNEKMSDPNLAVNYEFKQNKYNPARVLPFNCYQYSNGIYSTAGDLFKWHLSFYDTLVLDNFSNRLMHTAYTGMAGYGLSISKTKGVTRYESGVQREGISTCMIQLPQERICVIVLLNDFKDARSICEVLENIVSDKEVIMPYEHKEIKMSDKKLKNFEGIYTTNPDMKYFNFRVKIYDHKLFVLNRDSVELKPESETKFFYANGKDLQLEFLIDKEGKFIKGWQIRNGMKEEFMEFKRKH